MASKLETEHGTRLDEFMQPEPAMQIRRYPPDRQLAPYVRHFTLVEAAERATRILVPDGTIVIGIRYRGAAELLEETGARPMPDLAFTGVSTKARHMRTAAGSGIVLAAFHPGSAGAFFAPALHELFGQTLDLLDLLPRSDVQRAHERVRAATSDGERIAALGQLLVSCLRGANEDRLVLAAARALREAHGQIRIRELAQTLGSGQDALEKRFRRHIGASPKQLASILRLHRAITSYRPGTSLTQLALDAGYFDQAHFNRDVRSATGTSPQKLLAPAVHC